MESLDYFQLVLAFHHASGKVLAALDRLQSPVTVAKFCEGFYLYIILVVVALLISYKLVEELLQHCIRIRRALVRPQVRIVGAILFHLARNIEHLAHETL
jgi:hypothetical protein